MRLLLVRHAEPEANVRQVVAGPKGCTGLTDRGRVQARALGERLAGDAFRPDAVYASVLRRAVETAEIVAPALDRTRIEQDCALCELHPGACDGMPWADQVRVYGRGGDRDPDEPMSPGGESLRGFDRRARAALAALVERHPTESVVVFTHGGFITAVTLALLGLPGLGERREFILNPAYTSLTEWVREDRSAAWMLERYNDAAHLADLT